MKVSMRAGTVDTLISSGLPWMVVSAHRDGAADGTPTSAETVVAARPGLDQDGAVTTNRMVASDKVSAAHTPSPEFDIVVLREAAAVRDEAAADLEARARDTDAPWLAVEASLLRSAADRARVWIDSIHEARSRGGCARAAVPASAATPAQSVVTA